MPVRIPDRWSRAAESLFARRLIAVDPGRRSVKLILVEARFDRVRVLAREQIELPEEPAAPTGEWSRRVMAAIEELGDLPVALTLPQHLSISQVIDLPPADPGQVRELIENETVRISGVSESAVVYDSAALAPFGKWKNPFWVTLCQEIEIHRQIHRMGLPADLLCHVSSSANALVAAGTARIRQAPVAVMVDLGTGGTDVVILIRGQPAHVHSLVSGADTFTRALAAAKNCSWASAETTKRNHDLFQGPDRLEELAAAVDNWRREVERVVREWLEENPPGAQANDPIGIWLCGGAAAQPGLIAFLNGRSAFRFAPWQHQDEAGETIPAQFAAAFGTALTALLSGPKTTSLLPKDLRDQWNKRRFFQGIRATNVAMLVVLALLLLWGSWRQRALFDRKQQWLDQSAVALEKLKETGDLREEWTAQYQRLYPILAHQKQTLDTLQTWALLQGMRTNRGLWFVLFADQQSYFSAEPLETTNASVDEEFVISTNTPPAPKPGFIAELCFAEGGETMRRALSQVVADLKKHLLFRNVDTLPDDRRKRLVTPKVLVPDRHFALDIELARNPYRLTPAPAELPDAGATNRPALRNNGGDRPILRTGAPAG